MVIYGAGEVNVRVGGQDRPVGPGRRIRRGLRVIPLPAGLAIEAVKIVAPARLTRDTLTKGAAYQAALAWLTLLPQRAVNVAAAAGVHVSSADEPSKGFQPQPWLNRPETLVDGFIDERRNFFTAKREADITPDKPEWVMLHWDAPQTFGGLMIFRGRDEKGPGQAVVEQYVGAGEPRFSTADRDWRAIPGRWAKPVEGKGISQTAYFVDAPVTTKGLRLRCIGGVKQIGIGEVVVLRDLGQADAPSAPAGPAAAPVTIPFDIPAAGKVTIQVRDAAGEVVANPVTGVDFPAGRNTAGWDLTDVVGKPILLPGKYRWAGLHNPGLRVEYKFSYLPYPLAGVPWQTPSGRGGWLADHEPPRTIARAGDHMWLGAFAEAGDSIVEVDADMQKIWGIDRIWVAIPAEICTDGQWYYGWCEGGWINDNQAIIQSRRRRSARGKSSSARCLSDVTDDAMRGGPMKRGVTGFQVVGGRAFVSFQKLDVVQVFDLSAGLAGPWPGSAGTLPTSSSTTRSPCWSRISPSHRRAGSASTGRASW